jgi:tRNA-specific 2-thiouridylase
MLKTAVALSGGADSLMTLLLLRETGTAVMGVHALFHGAGDDGLPERLRSLCAELDAPFAVIDLRQEFEDLVVGPFVRAYQQGLTPNPCAACNPSIKFGLLLDRVRELGADRLATGHYARLEAAGYGPVLFRGLDQSKDQSYFLSMVPRERFERIVFPLSGWTKADVRKALDERGLTPPAGRESQEVCFIPADYRDFLRARKVRLGGPGSITLADGTVLGRHYGLWQHTLGQRKGLGIAYREPLYVTAKNFGKNALIVGPRSEAMSRGCRTDAPNLLCPPEHWPAEVLVQTIYRQRPEPAKVELDAGGMTITFPGPRAIPTPGQVAAVSSSAGQVLAGGVIREGGTHAA